MASESLEPDDELAALRRRIAQLEAAARHAEVHGSGAAAQNGGTALGERAVQTGGGNFGTIISGTQIVNHYLASGDARLGRDAIAQKVAGYLCWLQARTQHIELRGIEQASGAPVVRLPLETAYVPLRAKALPRLGEAPERLHVPRDPYLKRRSDPGFASGTEPAGAVTGESDVALNQVLALGPRLAIIGGPGCGKTTVLLHIEVPSVFRLPTGRSHAACGD